MASKAAPILRFDLSRLNQLACPVCRGSLRLAGLQIFCVGCNRAYPILDGIPVLIADRAKLAQGNP